MEGYDLEDIATASDPEFWKMIEKSRNQKTVPWTEVKKRMKK